MTATPHEATPAIAPAIAPDSQPDLRAAFAALAAAQARDPLPAWPERAQRLRRLARLVRNNRAAIAAAINADFGCRPAEEVDLAEVFPSLGGIAHALRHGRRWMRPRRSWAGFWFLPARTELRPRPRGVVGIIVPWNYPLFLSAGPLTDALAAGNRVMLKMSEYTPRFGALFAELVHNTFGDEEIIVVNGGVEVAQAFSGLSFDHLLFTGSTAVGRHVMQAAAANLTPVTLELGGKSPVIIGPGARFENAVERILVGKLLNAGQTCIAPDYVLLPRERIDEFVATARGIAARLYPDFAGNPQYASIVSERQHARLVRLRDEALAAGARAEVLLEGSNAATRRLAPTLLTGTTDDMAVMQEEIFGPLLPLVPYETLDEAIACVTERPTPLSLYIFDDERTTVDRILDQVQAGGVSVNDTLLHVAQHHLPFGGVGPSGMGAYHGQAGFDAFSHLVPVFRQARWNAAGWLAPPYGTRFRKLLQLLLGR